MSSTTKLEKFKGDDTQNVVAWFTNICQWAEFHEAPERKIVGDFPFHLEDQAKVWYDSLPMEQKSNQGIIKSLFFERFKELDNFLDLSVLQMKQAMTESVGDYITRIIKQAMIKNVPENLLLSVAMNSFKSDKIISCYTQP